MATTTATVHITIESTQFDAADRKLIEDAIAQRVEPVTRRELNRQIAMLREDVDE